MACRGLRPPGGTRAPRAGFLRHRRRELPVRQRHRAPDRLRVRARCRYASAGTGARRRLFADRPEAAAAHHAAAGRPRGRGAVVDGRGGRRAPGLRAHRRPSKLLTAAPSSAADRGRRPDAAGRACWCAAAGCAADLGRHEDARDDHDEALALARDLADEELEARALEGLGWTALWARDALGAVDLAERAGHLAESAAAAPGAAAARCCCSGASGTGTATTRERRAPTSRCSRSTPTTPRAAVAMAYRGALLQHMDRFAEARAVLERAVALCTRTGEFRTLLQSLFFCGLARGDVGDLAGALRSLDRARRLIDEAGVDYYRAGIETTTSWLWQELGDVGRAREHAEQAVELASRGGGALELEQGLHALLALADCDLLEGRDDDAGARRRGRRARCSTVPLPFRPRAAMRLLEMQARWEPGRAEALLEYARTFRSTKYEALALQHLGRDAEAAGVGRADPVRPGGRADRRARRRAAAARDRIAAALPPELRTRVRRARAARRCRHRARTEVPPRNRHRRLSAGRCPSPRAAGPRRSRAARAVQPSRSKKRRLSRWTWATMRRAPARGRGGDGEADEGPADTRRAEPGEHGEPVALPGARCLEREQPHHAGGPAVDPRDDLQHVGSRVVGVDVGPVEHRPARPRTPRAGCGGAPRPPRRPRRGGSRPARARPGARSRGAPLTGRSPDAGRSAAAAAGRR